MEPSILWPYLPLESHSKKKFNIPSPKRCGDDLSLKGVLAEEVIAPTKWFVEDECCSNRDFSNLELSRQSLDGMLWSTHNWPENKAGINDWNIRRQCLTEWIFWLQQNCQTWKYLMCYAQKEYSGWLNFAAGAKGQWQIMPLDQRMTHVIWHSRCWVVPLEQPRGPVASLSSQKVELSPFAYSIALFSNGYRNNHFLTVFNMLHMFVFFLIRILNGAGVGVKWTLKKRYAPVLSLTFVTGETLLSVAENSHGESAVPELSGSFSIGFKRSRIRPRVIKINTFNLEISICSHFSRCTVSVSSMFFSLSGEINLIGEMLILYFCAVFFGLGLNIYGIFSSFLLKLTKNILQLAIRSGCCYTCG